MYMKGVVSKKLLQDLINLYDTTIKHCVWSETNRFSDPSKMREFKGYAYDRLVEHLQVIIDGDFEEIGSDD